MDDPLRRKIVERLAVAGARTRRVGQFRDGRRRGRVRQRFGGEQIAGPARAIAVPPAPDLGGPVARTIGAVERRLHRHHHRRADRLEAEFLLAPPAHPDRRSRPAKGDDRGIGRRIVGAVVAVAARPLHVLDRDRRGIELQSPRQRVAQRVDPLRMRPHLRAARRDRAPARRTARPRRGRCASWYRSPRAGSLPAPDRLAAAGRRPGRSRAAAAATAPLPGTG